MLSTESAQRVVKVKVPNTTVADNILGPVVQSIVSLTSSLRVIWLTVYCFSGFNIQYSDIFC